MIYKYGNYAHANNEVELTVTALPIYSTRGFRQGTRYTHQLRGVLQAASQSALTTAIHQLELAYAYKGRDAGLYLDNGTTRTSHFLNSSAALGGVRVTAGPDYPNGDGAEYSTFRTYQITLEAVFPVTVGESELLTFQETLRYTGTTGPVITYLQTQTGPPQRQITAQRSTQIVTQIGSADGYTRYPTPPAPIWPAAEHVEQRQITTISPNQNGGSESQWRITWNYTFESTSPLSGNPNIR